MTKKITTTSEAVAKFSAFNIMMAFNTAGLTVSKVSLEKLRKSLQANLDIDRTAELYDDFLLFRVNKRNKGYISGL